MEAICSCICSLPLECLGLPGVLFCFGKRRLCRFHFSTVYHYILHVEILFLQTYYSEFIIITKAKTRISVSKWCTDINVLISTC